MDRKRFALASLLSGISVFVRPESVFLFLILFYCSRSIRPMVPGLLVTLTYPAIFQYFYGLPIPLSIYSKLVLNNELSFSRLLESAYPLVNMLIKNPFSLFLASFLTSSVISFALLPLITFLAYVATLSPVYFWYYPPYYPLIFVAASVGVRQLYFLTGSRRFVLMLLSFLVLHQTAFLAREWYLTKDSLYNSKKLKQVSETIDGPVAVGDIGVVGYYSNQKLLDLGGLVSPEISKCRENRSYEEGIYMCVKEFDPDYFIARGPIQNKVALRLNCTLLKDIGDRKLYSC